MFTLGILSENYKSIKLQSCAERLDGMRDNLIWHASCLGGIEDTKITMNKIFDFCPETLQRAKECELIKWLAAGK